MKELLDLFSKGLEKKGYTVEANEIVKTQFLDYGSIDFKKGIDYFAIMIYENIKEYPESIVFDQVEPKVSEIFPIIKEIAVGNGFTLEKFGINKDNTMLQRISKNNNHYHIVFFKDEEEDMGFF